MSETIHINPLASRTEQFAALLPQLDALVGPEPDRTANVANLMAALRDAFHWLWVGVYWVASADELVLGPFQGPVACTRIRKGRGVCGTAWQTCQPILVPDVDAFPGHIACSSASRSEVVVPIVDSQGHIIGVLDADSEHLSHFAAADVAGLQAVAKIIARL